MHLIAINGRNYGFIKLKEQTLLGHWGLTASLHPHVPLGMGTSRCPFPGVTQQACSIEDSQGLPTGLVSITQHCLGEHSLWSPSARVQTQAVQSLGKGPNHSVSLLPDVCNGANSTPTS